MTPPGSLPPGPGAPKWMQSLSVWGRSPGYLEHCAARYGDCFTIRSFDMGTSVMVSDPVSVQTLLSTAPDPPLAEGTEAIEALMGSTSLLMLGGSMHRKMRRLLLPAFAGDRTEAMRPAVQSIVHREIDRWRVGRVISLRPMFESVIIEVIVKFVFGIDESDPLYPEFTGTMGQFVGSKMGPVLTILLHNHTRLRDQWWAPWAPFQRLARRLDQLIYTSIDHCRTGRASDATDSLSILLRSRDQDGTTLTAKEIRDQILTLLLAGYATTSTVLASLFNLVTHDEDAVLGLRKDSTDNFAYGMSTIRETLRLCPPVFFIPRVLEQPMSVRGFEIAKGETVTLSTYLAHRHPDAFDHPNRFRPDRFLHSEPSRQTWVPFGAGVRRCIGQGLAMAELEEIVRAISARVVFEPLSAAPEPIKRHYIVYGPSRGTRVRVAEVA